MRYFKTKRGEFYSPLTTNADLVYFDTLFLEVL